MRFFQTAHVQRRFADPLPVAAVSADAAEPAIAHLSPEAIAEGTALVEAFLETWASRTAELPAAVADEAPTGETREDVELKELVRCFEEYKSKFEGSEWTREVLAKTY